MRNEHQDLRVRVKDVLPLHHPGTTGVCKLQHTVANSSTAPRRDATKMDNDRDRKTKTQREKTDKDRQRQPQAETGKDRQNKPRQTQKDKRDEDRQTKTG